MAIEVRPAFPNEIDTVRELWREYWHSIGLPEDFQGFADELRSLPGSYAPPHGVLLLAYQASGVAGTIALRRLSLQTCEVKRLYVRPHFRGLGVAKVLLSRAIEHARSIGYDEMCCDTLPQLTEARRLYDSYGFRECEPYSASPTPGAIYLSFRL